MVDLDGDGILALWNGVQPERQAEYDLWHTREHVPERVSVPGMLGARRYIRVDGPLPEYLTLYPMTDLGVLQSGPYLRLLEHPTAWSRSMRPFLTDFARLCCRRIVSFGGGMGCALVAVTLTNGADLRAPPLASYLRSLLRRDAFTAIHVIERDASVPDVPFSVGTSVRDFPRGGAILFEGFDETRLVSGTREAAAELVRTGLDEPGSTLTLYRLVYALDRVSLDRVVTLDPPHS